MPYCKKDMNKALYSVIKVAVGSKYPTLKVFASFFDSSAMRYFPPRCSSNRTPRNLMYLTLETCFFPILIQILVATELEEEWKIIKLFLLILSESVFASSHLFINFSTLLTFLMTSSRDSES